MDRASLGLIGAIIASIAGIYYLYTIVHGSTRPHRVTWGVWSLIGVLGVGSAIEGGAKAGSYVALVYVVLEIIVFLLSLSKKYGKPGGESYDYILGAIAVVALIIWRVADLSPNFAATVAVLADGTVAWFTLRESWRQPQTESLIAWLVDVPAAALGVAALASFSYAAIAYPLYLLIGNSAITTALVIRAWQRKLNKKT